MIDSPEITRTIINFKRLLLTDLTVEIGKIPNKKTLAEAIKTAGEPPGTPHTRGPAAAGAALASWRAPPPFCVPRLQGGAGGGAALTLLRAALHARLCAGARGQALHAPAAIRRGRALRPASLLALPPFADACSSRCADVHAKFAASSWGKKLARQSAKKKATDFDRYTAAKAKVARSAAINAKLAK